MTSSALHCARYSFTPHTLPSGGKLLVDPQLPCRGQAERRVAASLRQTALPTTIKLTHIHRKQCGWSVWQKGTETDPGGVEPPTLPLVGESALPPPEPECLSCFDLDKKCGSADMLPWRRETQRECLTVISSYFQCDNSVVIRLRL